MRFDLGDVYTIWLREFKRWTRSKSRIIASMAQPILWLVLFGTAFDAMFASAAPGGPGGVPGGDGLDFKSFFTPGIVAMTVLFGSIFAGIGLIFDREFGFLKEIMVAPVSRTSIMAGKGLGGATGAVISGLVIMVLAVLIGAQYTPDLPLVVAAVTAVATVLLISLAFVNMGIAFATKIHNFEGFQMVMNFLVMPMFFLSGAFYPVQNMPGWLQGATYINPLFYGVDALRHCFNGSAAAALPLGLDLAVLLGFTVATTAIGVVLFRRME
ncbi:MAG: ABC transporter permease [Thermoplasmata archaeon]|nr:ABC transporter permease [Thermoplasmata archaeon]NIS11111.1 ABC transporter permease [Thermoplasmata archaeon]NIS19225.1 ABC transporter permease [Thermoplasmata archaeon]NIT76290.1 ABC transporter permease [Thermoplasmata archaeon]NIU48357.1 ABC transporter permease [Thermoplasmata archaeon]